MNGQQFQPLVPDTYEVPASGGIYMKFVQGQNQFRILSSALLTYDIWKEGPNGREVQRVPYNPQQPPQGGAGIEINHAWHLLVYNYATGNVEVLSITQKGIMEAISNTTKLPGMQDYRTYDFVVVRKGEGFATKYPTIQALQPQQMTPEAWAVVAPALEKADLTALFTGGDPLDPQGFAQQQQPQQQFGGALPQQNLQAGGNVVQMQPQPQPQQQVVEQPATTQQQPTTTPAAGEPLF